MSNNQSLCQGRPPVGGKSVPDNVTCYDVKTGKVLHTEATVLPTQPLTDEQKAVLNGNAPVLKPVDPQQILKDAVSLTHQFVQESVASINLACRHRDKRGPVSAAIREPGVDGLIGGDA